MPKKPMLLLQKDDQGLQWAPLFAGPLQMGREPRMMRRMSWPEALLLEKLVIFCVSMTKDLQQQLKEEFIFVQFGGTVHVAHSVGPGTLSTVRK